MKGMTQAILLVMESKLRGQPTPKLSYAIIAGQNRVKIGFYRCAT